MNKKNITVIALVLGQGLTGSVISLLTLTSTLVGYRLSPFPYLITLPITATVVGAAITVYYASYLMNAYGRRISFSIGSFIGLLGSTLAAMAVYYQLFSLFVFSTLILGGATVFNQYYRFAGAEIFDNESSKKKCTSFIIGGGVIGGVLGPLIATKGEYMFPEHLFLGTFLISGLVFISALISQIFIFLPRSVILIDKKKVDRAGGGLKNVLLSSRFLIGTLSCAFGFSVMTLVMNATPLAMLREHYNIQESAYVLQWHFLAMYAPALFLPLLVSRLKTIQIINFGAIFFLAGTLSSFYWNNLSGYIFSLSTVGIGWSFMFTGGTFLINQLTDPKIKHKVQGINSSITYLFNLIASLSVGFFMSTSSGWLIINAVAATVIFIFLIYIIFYTRSKVY